MIIYPLYAVMYLIKSLLVVLSISPYKRKCLCEKKSGNEGRSSEPEETSSAGSASSKIKNKTLETGSGKLCW